MYESQYWHRSSYEKKMDIYRKKLLVIEKYRQVGKDISRKLIVTNITHFTIIFNYVKNLISFPYNYFFKQQQNF